MRNAGRLKLGYYPLPLAEALRLRLYSHVIAAITTITSTARAISLGFISSGRFMCETSSDQNQYCIREVWTTAQNWSLAQQLSKGRILAEPQGDVFEENVLASAQAA